MFCFLFCILVLFYTGLIVWGLRHMSALTDVISDLKTSVEGLSARIDAHKAKDEEIVDALNATIVDLKQTIQDLKNGQTGSEAEITKAVADLTALKNSLDGQMVE